MKILLAGAAGQLGQAMRLINYNHYALFRFLEFTWRTADMTGDPCGYRKLGDYFNELAAAQKANSGRSA